MPAGMHRSDALPPRTQPVEGLRAGTGGMLMHLGGCSLGAAFEEDDDLSEQSHAHAGAPPLVWGVGPGVAAEMLAVEWVLLRMEYPMLVGGGAAAGVPELSTRLSLPADPTLRATPRQLALLAAVQAYNLASMPLYVHPLPHLPPLAEVLRVELVALPLLRVQLHAPQLGSSALFRRGSFASADHRQRFENNGVLAVLPDAFERVCSIALRGLGLRWLWRNNLSATLSLSLEALCVHGESAALRHELEDGWGWEDEDDEEALAAAVPLEARGLGVPLLSSAPRATPKAAALPSAPISSSEISAVARQFVSGEEDEDKEAAEDEEGEEGAAPYLSVEPSAAQHSGSASCLNTAAAAAASAQEGGGAAASRPHPPPGRRHRRSTSDPQLNLNLIKDELELPPGSVALLASSPSAHHSRSNSVFVARDNQLAARGSSGLAEMSAPSPRRRMAPMHDVSLEAPRRPRPYRFRTLRTRPLLPATSPAPSASPFPEVPSSPPEFPTPSALRNLPFLLTFTLHPPPSTLNRGSTRTRSTTASMRTSGPPRSSCVRRPAAATPRPPAAKPAARVSVCVRSLPPSSGCGSAASPHRCAARCTLRSPPRSSHRTARPPSPAPRPTAPSTAPPPPRPPATRPTPSPDLPSAPAATPPPRPNPRPRPRQSPNPSPRPHPCPRRQSYSS